MMRWIWLTIAAFNAVFALGEGIRGEWDTALDKLTIAVLALIIARDARSEQAQS